MSAGYSAVGALVLDELGALAEGQAKGLSPRWVRRCCERGPLAEGLAALGAGQGPLTRVGGPGLREPRHLREAQATLAADVGLLARVRPLVARERGPMAEGLAALGTGEGLLARVGALVLREVGAPREAPRLRRNRRTCRGCARPGAAAAARRGKALILWKAEGQVTVETGEGKH